MPTYAEQLAEVQAAIGKIMANGQEYEIGDRRMRYAELKQLQDRERYLTGMANRETTGHIGPRMRQFVPRND